MDILEDKWGEILPPPLLLSPAWSLGLPSSFLRLPWSSSEQASRDSPPLATTMAHPGAALGELAETLPASSLSGSPEVAPSELAQTPPPTLCSSQRVAIMVGESLLVHPELLPVSQQRLSPIHHSLWLAQLWASCRVWGGGNSPPAQSSLHCWAQHVSQAAAPPTRGCCILCAVHRTLFLVCGEFKPLILFQSFFSANLGDPLSLQKHLLSLCVDFTIHRWGPWVAFRI